MGIMGVSPPYGQHPRPDSVGYFAPAVSMHGLYFVGSDPQNLHPCPPRWAGIIDTLETSRN